jgi:hypothetical protein
MLKKIVTIKFAHSKSLRFPQKKLSLLLNFNIVKKKILSSQWQRTAAGLLD